MDIQTYELLNLFSFGNILTKEFLSHCPTKKDVESNFVQQQTKFLRACQLTDELLTIDPSLNFSYISKLKNELAECILDPNKFIGSIQCEENPIYVKYMQGKYLADAQPKLLNGSVTLANNDELLEIFGLILNSEDEYKISSTILYNFINVLYTTLECASEELAQFNEYSFIAKLYQSFEKIAHKYELFISCEVSEYSFSTSAVPEETYTLGDVHLEN